MNGEAAPYAREGILQAVETQIREGDPPEAREALERLMEEGYSREDAVILIARALAVEMFEIVKHKREHDTNRYAEALRALPRGIYSEDD